MTLSTEQVDEIESILTSSIRAKFQNYNPETTNMPFHTRLLGKDRLALYSFIHSLNTNFGSSIFEPVGVALAKSNFSQVEKQFHVGNEICVGAQIAIQKIIDQLTSAENTPNKARELEEIRDVCQKGSKIKVNPINVDLMVKNHEGEIFLFDLKTAKPNVGNFREFKRTLLEWAAILMAKDREIKVNSLIAIPYNPYEPAPYERWTIRGMIDLPNELKVANEFWDFLGGKGTYNDLLDCFERVGIKMRSEIDDFFKRFKK